METNVIETNDGATMELIGHLDTRTVKETRDAFLEAGEKYSDLVLDMAQVSYISSAGIRALRDLYMVMYNKNGTLRMTNVNDTVMRVLEMTGLKGLLNL